MNAFSDPIWTSPGISVQPSATKVEWPTPVDLFADEPGGAPTLQPHHVPTVIWNLAADSAARMGVDPTAVAFAAIVACAAVMTDDWAVQPKRYDTTWTENPRLWFAIVGDPSILKTPVISAATKPIDSLEADARARHSVAMRAWKVAEAEAKAAKTASPPPPRCDRFMVEGTTIEALSEVLRDDEEAKARTPSQKVLSRQDEMAEFFGGLDKYKAGGRGGSDRGAYLRLYNGGRHTIDRVGRGSFAVPNWSACFLGGIQPGPIQRIARDASEDGLLQRFLYCVPDRRHSGQDRSPNAQALADYSALFPALVGLHPRIMVGATEIRPVIFHAEAHQHREAINALADVLALMPDTSARMKAALGKWPGLFARLCLTFHLIEIANERAQSRPLPVVQVIPARVASQVAALIREIILPHLIRAHAVMFATDQTGHAKWIAGFILSQGAERITTRDIARAYGALRAPEDKAELASVMDSLVAIGWLEPETTLNSHKPVSAWAVNPVVHEQFAERAKAETERRAEVKAKITSHAATLRGIHSMEDQR